MKFLLFLCALCSLFILATAISSFPTHVASIPSDWNEAYLNGDLLFSDHKDNKILFPAVGNGYLATTLYSDTLYISGVYNGQAPDAFPENRQKSSAIPLSHRARIPSPVNIQIDWASFNFEGTVRNKQNPSVQEIGYALDMRQAIFKSRHNVSTADAYAIIEQVWFAHRRYPHALVYGSQLVQQSSNVEGVDFKLSNNAGPDSTDISFRYVHEPRFPELKILNGTILYSETDFSPLIKVCLISPSWNSTSVHLLVNSPAKLFLTTGLTTLDEGVTPAILIQKGLDLHQELTLRIIKNQTDFIQTHLQDWTEILQNQIQISGDLQLAQVVNSSFWYILTSIRDDWHWGLSPGGLASDSYNGHVFWDQETWMYPTLALFQPNIARSCLMYRFNHIHGAALKAKSYSPSYDGLMFPWESAESGIEVCPPSAPTGKLEQHISGDIAFAIIQYWRLTGNVTWLRTEGWPILEGTALFWASRVSKGSDGFYHIDGVIPPDEYAVNVDDSAYTNAVASFTLEYASKIGDFLGESVPQTWNEISKKLKIVINKEEDIILEYENYNGQKIKQADVVLIDYPLMRDFYGLANNNLNYYAAKTDPAGPAMTWAMYVVGYLAQNQTEKANSLFPQSYANAQAPFFVWTETPTGGAINFITGAGGFLQGIWAGFSFLRITDEGLQFNERRLPGASTALVLKGIAFQESRIQVSIFESQTTVSLDARGPFRLEIVYEKTAFLLNPNRNITLSSSIPFLIRKAS